MVVVVMMVHGVLLAGCPWPGAMLRGAPRSRRKSRVERSPESCWSHLDWAGIVGPEARRRRLCLDVCHGGVVGYRRCHRIMSCPRKCRHGVTTTPSGLESTESNGRSRTSKGGATTRCQASAVICVLEPRRPDGEPRRPCQSILLRDRDVDRRRRLQEAKDEALGSMLQGRVYLYLQSDGWIQTLANCGGKSMFCSGKEGWRGVRMKGGVWTGGRWWRYWRGLRNQQKLPGRQRLPDEGSGITDLAAGFRAQPGRPPVQSGFACKVASKVSAQQIVGLQGTQVLLLSCVGFNVDELVDASAASEAGIRRAGWSRGGHQGVRGDFSSST
jgi:hypothetical protein